MAKRYGYERNPPQRLKENDDSTFHELAEKVKKEFQRNMFGRMMKAKESGSIIEVKANTLMLSYTAYTATFATF